MVYMKIVVIGNEDIDLVDYMRRLNRPGSIVSIYTEPRHEYLKETRAEFQVTHAVLLDALRKFNQIPRRHVIRGLKVPRSHLPNRRTHKAAIEFRQSRPEEALAFELREDINNPGMASLGSDILRGPIYELLAFGWDTCDLMQICQARVV